MIIIHNWVDFSLSDIECDGCIQMFEEMEVLIPKKVSAKTSVSKEWTSLFINSKPS